MKKAFTLIELIIVIAIISILASAILPILIKVKNKSHDRQHIEQTTTVNPRSIYHVGDTVSIDSLSITGTINNVYNRGRSSDIADIIVKGTNGMPTILERINTDLLKKVVLPEDWKK